MSSLTAPTAVVLNDSQRVPQIGLGTWPLSDREAASAVSTALEVGYRLIDTAAIYGNERGVGKGIRDSGVERSQIILTSKVRGADHGYDSTLRAFDSSAKRLGLEQIDLYLIHWPLPEKNLYVDTWRALIKLRDDGKAKSIGVSNFQPHHLDRIIDETGVVPSVNQVELHPEFPQTELRKYHKRHDIATEDYTPLGRGREVQSHGVISKLAKKYGKTPAQIVLRWHVEIGNIAIPKSQRPERIRENFEIFDFALSREDLDEIAALDRGRRLGGDPDYTFEE